MSCSAVSCQERKLVLTVETRCATPKALVAAGSRSLRSRAKVTGRSWDDASVRASDRVIQARPLESLGPPYGPVCAAQG